MNEADLLPGAPVKGELQPKTCYTGARSSSVERELELRDSMYCCSCPSTSCRLRFSFSRLLQESCKASSACCSCVSKSCREVSSLPSCACSCLIVLSRCSTTVSTCSLCRRSFSSSSCMVSSRCLCSEQSSRNSLIFLSIVLESSSSLVRTNFSSSSSWITERRSLDSTCSCSWIWTMRLPCKGSGSRRLLVPPVELRFIMETLRRGPSGLGAVGSGSRRCARLIESGVDDRLLKDLFVEAVLGDMMLNARALGVWTSPSAGVLSASLLSAFSSSSARERAGGRLFRGTSDMLFSACLCAY
eukprot:m.39908 g.39908  ORF g.39908 m.39908 type:complete len:301 (-) comp45723_c0_seq1:126-1028(-)